VKPHHCLALLPVLAACGVLAGCSQAPQQINSSPPTVTYQVTGNDVSEADAEAQNYCARSNRHAVFEGVKATSWGKAAVYRCDTPAPGAGAPPPPPSGSTVVGLPPPSESTAEEPPPLSESTDAEPPPLSESTAEEPPPPLGSTALEPEPPSESTAVEPEPPSESTAVEPEPPSGNTAVGPPRRLTPPAQ